LCLVSRPTMERNLLPQQLGFKPGTSLVGSFGTTAARFNRLPMDGSPEPRNPGPGTYNLRIGPAQATPFQAAAPRWSWGTGAGHNLSLGSHGATPGPGAYGEDQQLDGGMLTHMRRQWPGITSLSSFGTNATLPTLQKHVDSGMPGPGAYDPQDAAHFRSNARMANSPFLAAARQRTGSHLTRDLDSKPTAVFASGRAAHALPAPGDESGASISKAADGPGPSYLPMNGTISASLAQVQRNISQRWDGGSATNFDSTAKRFEKSSAAADKRPGPGSYTISRWSGEPHPSFRQPRSNAPGTSGKTGFLSSAQRFRGPSKEHSSSPELIMQYLAKGELGTVGLPTHAASAKGKVVAQVAANGSMLR
jgi:hypothetical protein